MIHTCKLQCHAVDPEKADMMGLKDEGKWLPFAFHMDIVIAIKMTTDDSDDIAFERTTIFTENGDTFIINTPYEEFLKYFLDYHPPTLEAESKDDIDL